MRLFNVLTALDYGGNDVQNDQLAERGLRRSPFTLVIEIDVWNIRERDNWGKTEALVFASGLSRFHGSSIDIAMAEFGE